MLADKKKKLLLILMISFSVLGISMTFYFYQVFYSPNTLTESDQPYTLKIPSNANFQYVANELFENKVINDPVSFGFVSKVLDYQELVKPGLYTIQPKMTNLELVRLLRSGNQTPVRITFNNVRTKEDLAEKITTNLEISQEQFLNILKDSVYIRKFDFNEETVMGMFIPNTYEVWWNTSPEALFDRMYKEYESFWTEARKEKAQKIGLNPKEVTTLASIVQAESQKADERPRIAGVYLNRLRLKMPLQADPTLVFALGDFSLKRVLNIHKETESPYNTYKYAGLPPGPINLPDINSLDAVLNAEKHSYLYFCAKEDFSGYHAFATTLAQHNANARRYQAALNAARIF
ncbi:endolytic transglycosylase MltG [Algoriphagus sp. CAU 1675]|uniref:endolytic transglycosylase MltG n=1 Tax=Algoriphagus sp. CAU 1675 TaxID=3032597 RepID=UPI0023DA2B40|nr:endolytic transglycosylase MltG [Algoriphagus sp. CAU 1675]MDF2157402.1 endolytic transglycosylase MltG [Algoriphagus sp. CAU 1675]